jgi:hypothetical protein
MVTPDLVSGEDIAKLIIPDDLPDEPSFKAYIEAKVYDKEGHLIQHHKQPMRSLTKYFLALMSIPLIGTYQGSSSYQATGILTSTLGLPSQQSSGSHTANIAWNWSIQLGSGTQTFNPSLTSLASPIANGTGAGQLAYSTTNVSLSMTSIIISVVVSSSTPVPINVTEIGLLGTVYLQYANSNGGYASSTYNFLLSYDTFSTAISIPPGGMAVFQITLSFSG